MASPGHLTVKLDAREIVLSIEKAVAMLPKPTVSPASLAVAAAVAAGSTRKVSRRALLGLWRHRG